MDNVGIDNRFSALNYLIVGPTLMTKLLNLFGKLKSWSAVSTTRNNRREEAKRV